MAYLKEEIKAGAIIVIALVLLSGSVILIGGSHFFERFDLYYLKVYNTAGLEAGSQVRLGGFRVGKVMTITPPAAAKEPVTVALAIKQGTELYKGTRAQISQIGFVGDIYLLLAVDKTSQEKLKPGDIIPSEGKIEFDALMARADELSQALTGIIKDANKIFAPTNIKRIEDLLDNTNKAIVSGSSNLDRMTALLKKTTEKTELVLAEIEGLIRDNKGEVALVIKNAKESLDKAKSLITTLEDTTKTIGTTTKTVGRSIDQQAQNIDNLLTTLTSTTEDLQELMQEIKNKPWTILYKGETKGE